MKFDLIILVCVISAWAIVLLCALNAWGKELIRKIDTTRLGR